MSERKKIGNIRFGKTLECLIWLAGIGVLVANIFLLQRNRKLNEALAPQITSGTHVEMLAGLALDGRKKNRRQDRSLECRFEHRDPVACLAIG